jgi:hypothetical protein
VLDSFLDLRDDDFVRNDAFGNNAFHLDTRECEKIIDFLDGFPGKVEVSREPVK